VQSVFDFIFEALFFLLPLRLLLVEEREAISFLYSSAHDVLLLHIALSVHVRPFDSLSFSLSLSLWVGLKKTFTLSRFAMDPLPTFITNGRSSFIYPFL
jgi:hypothetical protein